MDIIEALAREYNPKSETTPPAVISPLQNIVPPMISNDINLDTLLRDTSRTKNHTPGNGHNNCAFNAVLEQVGNRTSNSEMVNLLRSSLGYANENSGTMLWSTSCSDIASLFQRPVVVIQHNNRNQITEVSLCMLSTEAGLPVHDFLFQEYQFFQNFVQFRGSMSQEEVNDLSRYVAGLNEATVFDIVVQLLQHPETIALVHRNGSNHSDAAPHRNLPWEDNVLEFLGRAADHRRAAD